MEYARMIFELIVKDTMSQLPNSFKNIRISDSFIEWVGPTGKEMRLTISYAERHGDVRTWK